MITHRLMGVLISLTLAACASSPQTSPLETNRGKYTLQGFQITRLVPISVSSSSELNWRNTTYRASRAIDNNLDIEWASADGDTNPTYTLQFDRPERFESIRIKTWPGTNYRVRVSRDGYRWRDASEPLGNGSWDLEGKPIRGEGLYLQIAFDSPPPAGVNHFSIFEIEPYGTDLYRRDDEPAYGPGRGTGYGPGERRGRRDWGLRR